MSYCSTVYGYRVIVHYMLGTGSLSSIHKLKWRICRSTCNLTRMCVASSQRWFRCQERPPHSTRTTNWSIRSTPTCPKNLEGNSEWLTCTLQWWLYFQYSSAQHWWTLTSVGCLWRRRDTPAPPSQWNETELPQNKWESCHCQKQMDPAWWQCASWWRDNNNYVSVTGTIYVQKLLQCKPNAHDGACTKYII